MGVGRLLTATLKEGTEKVSSLNEKCSTTEESFGLALICINLENLIKTEGDAVHTVDGDTFERTSPLRIAVIMGLALLMTVGGLGSPCCMEENSI